MGLGMKISESDEASKDKRSEGFDAGRVTSSNLASCIYF